MRYWFLVIGVTCNTLVQSIYGWKAWLLSSGAMVGGFLFGKLGGYRIGESDG